METPHDNVTDTNNDTASPEPKDATLVNETSEGPTPHTQPAHEAVVPTEDTQPWYTQKTLMVSLSIALILLLGAAGWYGYTTYLAPVAKVNDSNITKKEFNENVTLISNAAIKQGADLTDPTILSGIREQALTILVEDALFRDAAARTNITSTQEDVDIEYTNLLNQVGGAEKLAGLIIEAGITDEKLRENIQKRVIVNKYIEQETDIENIQVTPEEIDAFLKSMTAGGNELPSAEVLEKIRPQIEGQLLEQQRQKIVSDLVAKMKAEAEIVIYIEP